MEEEKKTIVLKHPLGSTVYFFEDNKIQKGVVRAVEIKLEYFEKLPPGENIFKEITYDFENGYSGVIKEENVFSSPEKVVEYLKENIMEGLET